MPRFSEKRGSMKILNLTVDSKMYTSNVYLVLGTWNAIGDVNTLVDVGRDPAVIDKIRAAPTGVGKKRVDQVVLTHSHYDHAGLLPLVKKVFDPLVCAFTMSLQHVDRVLKDGDFLEIGDDSFEVIHAPGHSSDSVCLYCKEDGALFTGDVPVPIHFPGGTYEQGFVAALERICEKDVRAIFPGHGNPIPGNCNSLIRGTLENVRKSVNKAGNR